VPKTGTPEEN